MIALYQRGAWRRRSRNYAEARSTASDPGRQLAASALKHAIDELLQQWRR